MPSSGFGPPGPLVSIVTPTLNQSAYIEATVRSVLTQDYPCIEHIVIDGGSTDGTLDILRRYPHLKWVSEPDGGQTQAINKGLRMAKGDIVTWLNSDDLLLPGAVSAAVQCFQQHPEADFVYGDCQIIDESGQPLLVRRVTPYDWGVLLYGRSLINQPASFFRRRVLDTIGLLDERFPFCMDLEFWARAGQRGMSFHMLPMPLACFRLHGSAKTARLRPRMIAEHLEILKIYSRFPWQWVGPFEQPFQSAFNLCHHVRSVIRRMWHRKDFQVLQASRAQRLVSARAKV